MANKTRNKKSHNMKARPQVCRGATTIFRLGSCKLFVTVNHDGNNVIEVITQIFEGDRCCKAILEGLSRLISLCLQNHIPVSKVARILKGIRCKEVAYSRARGQKTDALSCGDAIYRVLKEAETAEDEWICNLISKHGCRRCEGM